ncbi:MAG TPA: hypothetical protein VN647_00720, partial [Nitrospira sp.]|nr:hypothetical protein [Nitrospira sp.]
SALRLKDCAGKSEIDKACAAGKQDLNTSPVTPDGHNVGMQYDVMLPGGKTLGGLIPWSAQYNRAH